MCVCVCVRVCAFRFLRQRGKIHRLIFLNVNSYAGGAGAATAAACDATLADAGDARTDLWGDDADVDESEQRRFRPASVSDGLLEVVGVTGQCALRACGARRR